VERKGKRDDTKEILLKSARGEKQKPFSKDFLEVLTLSPHYPKLRITIGWRKFDINTVTQWDSVPFPYNFLAPGHCLMMLYT
jgi:hypothetical protein